MSDDRRNYMADWEDQVNALMDGELDDSAAGVLHSQVDEDSVLASAIIDAYRLQRVLAAIPAERAPSSLRRKLRRIPAQHKAQERPRYLQPRWAFAMAAVPLLVAFLFWDAAESPQSAEVAQGKQDLALALAYFDKVNRRATIEITATLEDGFRVPVTKNTVRTLRGQLELNREYEL